MGRRPALALPGLCSGVAAQPVSTSDLLQMQRSRLPQSLNKVSLPFLRVRLITLSFPSKLGATSPKKHTDVPASKEGKCISKSTCERGGAGDMLPNATTYRRRSNPCGPGE